MRKKLFKIIIVLLVLNNTCISFAQKNNKFETIYKSAIQDAMYPQPSKIDSNLVCINNQNPNLIWKKFNGEDYVLVVTWKQNISYYEPYLDSVFYNTGGYPIWITTAPELLQRMKNEKYNDVNLRLKQLLGLPPTSVYSYFVEFWVKPSDLFRPCPDSEINDNKCEICFPSDVDSSYISWINTSRIERYYQCLWYNQYPWTQLGYTYDWNPENKKHIGLSEFVIKKNTNIKVKAIYTTIEYLKIK